MSDQGSGTDLVEATPASPAVPAADVVERADEHAHPGPRQYVVIAVVLSILTALEVGLYYLEGDVSNNLLIVLLAVLATLKFFLVAAWYMHMRMDAPFFRRIFVVGLVGAMIVYGVVMLTFASTVLA